MALSRRCIPTMNPSSFQSGRCGLQTVNGCGSRSACVAMNCGCAPGRQRSAACIFISSTATTVRTTRVRESMTRLTGVYSANRSVRQYLEDCYLPAATAYHQRAANGGAAAVALISRLQALNQGWPSLRFGDVCVDTRDRQHRFRAHVVLGTLPPEAIRVQLYADAVPGASRVLEDMVRAPA